MCKYISEDYKSRDDNQFSQTTSLFVINVGIIDFDYYSEFICTSMSLKREREKERDHANLADDGWTIFALVN